MFCWQARRGFAAYLERSIEAASRVRLEEHLSSCAACRTDLDDASRISEMVGEAGRLDGPVLTPVESDGFERSVMRAIRSRQGSSPAETRPGWLGPAPITAAASLMLLAVVAALLIGSPPERVTASAAGQGASPVVSGATASGSDLLVAPREIPFTYVQDLVGSRRGHIPLTTYVLEPAPDDRPVVRASL